MPKQKLTVIIALMALNNFFLPVTSLATGSDIVISEVMSNPVNETTDEFIELYNNSETALDLSGWHFTDGDGVDEIIAWDSLSHGDIPGASLNTTIVPAESYAVILDPDYNSGGLPYNFPDHTVILTVPNSSLGNGLTPASDPLVLYRAGGTTQDYVVDTYGTPFLDDDPLLCDDDALDDIPFDPGDGVSVEKIDPAGLDTSTNWSINADNTSTPGAINNPLVNEPPVITDVKITPQPVPIDGATSVLIEVKITDPNGAADLALASANLTPLNGSAEQTLYDDGSHGDKLDGDEWYSYLYLPPENLEAGDYQLLIVAIDNQDQTASCYTTVTLEEIIYSDQVVISEILPNPAGVDTAAEFIELYNSGSETLDLKNWQLTDGATAYYLPENTALAAKSYLAFFSAQTKISLNNSGDTVSLLSPAGDLVSRIGYAAAPGEDLSYMRGTDNKFSWTTTPTPNAANVLTSTAEENENAQDEDRVSTTVSNSSKTSVSSTSTKNAAAEKSESSFEEMSIAQARQADKNTKATVTGIITASPKMLSDKFFYIQDTESGLQIYSSKADFPELKLGQEITASGTVSEAQGEKKLNIAAADAIKILGQKEVPAAQETATGQIAEELEGKLVKLSAAISRQSGKTFYLHDGGGEAKISITGDFAKPEIKKGEVVQITGIVGQTSAGYRVMPRQAEDIKKGEVAGAEASADDNTVKKLPAAGPSSNLFVIIILVTAGAGVAIKIIWNKRKTKAN